VNSLKVLNLIFKKEKKILESKRLELDACKARLRKLSEYANMKDVSILINFKNKKWLSIYLFWIFKELQIPQVTIKFLFMLFYLISNIYLRPKKI